MRAYLFRRVLVDGVNYYQLYKVDNNFENKESLYKSFNQRDSSDYFYLDASFVDKNDLEYIKKYAELKRRLIKKKGMNCF